MNFIRKILFILLGKDLYFKLISKVFIWLFQLGFLKHVKKFNTHHFVRGLINKGDCIIDIGANFGYYTTIFAKRTGNTGLVYAVEPVAQYRQVLLSNTRKLNNIVIIPFALSDIEGKSEMGIPGDKKYRHGLTRILNSSESKNNKEGYRIETKTPGNLFNHLEKIDYIKCDIEGYESKVIPEFRSLIEKFNPIVQIEIEKTNFGSINDFFHSLGYKAFKVSDYKLIQHNKDGSYNSDLIYLTKNQINQLTQNNLIP
ncbi:MAG: FkbM family methyltransferase [Bacteroidales bacterium]|nr:FkbM family methyltransferase [Bacteroidales bacterium]